MKPQEPLKVANFEWVWVGLVDGVKWCHGTATCSQGFASNRSFVNKMPCFLQTLTGNLFVWMWFWLQNSILCTVGPIGDFPFLVSNSWCVHPRLCCSSFSSSATRLGGCDLAYLVEHADPLLISWISDLISLVWLTSLCLLIGCCAFIWCHAFISGCWDWREKAEKDSWYSIQAYSSKVSIFKLIVEIHLLSYSMLWASPSLTRHDVPSKRPSSMSFMEVRATVDCCSSAWVLENEICSPCLGFANWAFGIV